MNTNTNVNVITEGGTIDPRTTSANDLAGLFQAARERKIVVQSAGELLTVTPTRTSVKAANRAKRQERLDKVKAAVLDVVTANHPTKIGPVVTKVNAAGCDADRNEVLQALRELRSDGKLVSKNETGSNFHMTWDLTSDSDTPTPAEPAASAPAAEEPAVTNEETASTETTNETTSDDSDLGSDAA